TLQQTLHGESHHSRGTDHDGNSFAHVLELQIGDVLGDKTDLMFSSFLAAVQGEDHIHFLTPVREIVFEQEVLHGLESSDQSHVLALILMLCKVGDHTPHWRNTGATCDNNQFLALVVLQIEAISVGAAHQEAVAHIM